LVGYTWRITEVRHDGDSTSIPAALDGYVAFAPDGTLGASDGVNGYFGRYAVEGTGYRPNNAGFTLVGYSGHDPSQLALIAAVQALTRSDVVSATEDGTDRIQLTVHGYTVTCARHGAARNEPTPSPTSTHS
jgi:hypothetical protein